MATIRLGSFQGDTVIFEADYHDGNKRVMAVRCINNGSANARGTLLEQADSSIVGQATFLPGTTQINIPQGKTVTIDAVMGATMPYELRLEYPVP